MNKDDEQKLKEALDSHLITLESKRVELSEGGVIYIDESEGVQLEKKLDEDANFSKTKLADGLQSILKDYYRNVNTAHRCGSDCQLLKDDKHMIQLAQVRKPYPDYAGDNYGIK